MVKLNKTISLEEEIINKLSLEENASGLIEELLRKYYDFKVFNSSVHEDIKELENKAKELNLQLEEVNHKKQEALSEKEVLNKLKDFGIDNPFLIERLKKAEREPSVFDIKSLKEQYHIKLSEAIWKAWRMLHNQDTKEVKVE